MPDRARVRFARRPEVEQRGRPLTAEAETSREIAPSRPPDAANGGARAVFILCLALFFVLGVAIFGKIRSDWGDRAARSRLDRGVEAQFWAQSIEARLNEAFAAVEAAELAKGGPNIRAHLAARFGLEAWTIWRGGVPEEGFGPRAPLAAGEERAHAGRVALGAPLAVFALDQNLGRVLAIRAAPGLGAGVRIAMILPARSLAPALRVGFTPGLRAGLAGRPVWNTAAQGARGGRRDVGAARIGGGDDRLSLYALAANPAPDVDLAAGLQIGFFLFLFIAPALACWGLVTNVRIAAKARAEAEIARERAEQRLRLTFAQAPFGAWEWRASEDCLLLNREFARLLGLSETKALTIAEFLALIDPRDHDNFRRALAAMRRGAAECALRAQRFSRPVWIECRGGPVDYDGERSAEGARRVQGIAADVTAMREIEPRVRALQRRLSDAIEGFAGPFALFDAHQKLVIANRRFLLLFGAPSSAAWAGARYETVMLAASACIRAESPDPEDSQARIVEMLDGHFYKLVDRRTAEGGMVSVGVDITAQKKIEAALETHRSDLSDSLRKEREAEMRASQLARQNEIEKLRAEEASTAKSAFLANMSHELRTPLNAVIGFSEVMANEVFGPLGHDKYKQYAKDIWESGQHLLDLISDVLDTAKVEAGKMTPNLAPIDLEEVIDSAVRITRRRAEEKRITIEVDYGAVQEIDADHRQLKQMMLNLLSNSIKFTHEGGKVTITTELHENEVHIAVRDNGVGIPAEHLPRLARPFEQVENQLSRVHRGTGLGLALTKSLVEMHGGRFQIESELGKGTLVTLVFPVVRTSGGAAHIAA